MSAAPLLVTNGLAINFGGVRVLRGIDFTVRRRELRCIIGPNGAGKSTLFKCLTGELVPSAGSILFKGKPIVGLPSFDIAQRGIGIKTQVPSLFDGLPAGQNIWLAARRRLDYAAAWQTTRSLMDRIGIGTIADAIVGRLAHGQRQLVELAMVVAADPELILLDEPAAGMTKDEVGHLADLVRELSKEHGIIVVEHDMQFIGMIATIVTVLHRGEILVEDEVDRVMADPRVRSVYLGQSKAV
jgi:branched-chain amino acid transport system ATP-binding protein